MGIEGQEMWFISNQFAGDVGVGQDLHGDARAAAQIAPTENLAVGPFHDADFVVHDPVILHDKPVAEQRGPAELPHQRPGELLEGVRQNDDLRDWRRGFLAYWTLTLMGVNARGR